MAKLATISLNILTISCLLVSTLGVYARKQGPVEEEEANLIRYLCLIGKEKAVKLHFYVQDLGTNHPNTTTYVVAQASITSNSPTGFGVVKVVDDLITVGPDADSQMLGRIQGLVTKSDLSVVGITMNVNMYFTVGEYAGSTLSILGRNEMNANRRELVVAGGTGVFRFARGYAIQTTYSQASDFAVLGYDVYVITYNDANFMESDDV